MTPAALPDAIADALSRMLPGSAVRRVSTRGRHSSGLEGRKIMVQLDAGSEADPKAIDDFLRRLPDVEFDLTDEFVADISACKPANDLRAIGVWILLLRE